MHGISAKCNHQLLGQGASSVLVSLQEPKEQSWECVAVVFAADNPKVRRAPGLAADTGNYCTLPKSCCSLISPSSLGRLSAFIPAAWGLLGVKEGRWNT